jgi:hypothetical protein
VLVESLLIARPSHRVNYLPTSDTHWGNRQGRHRQPVVLERDATSDGRAGREEFWFFVLANIAVYFALLILAQISEIFMVLYFL